MQVAVGEVASLFARIKEDGQIERIADERLHFLMVVEAHAHVDFAVFQAEVGEPAGAGFLPLELLRMHKKYEARARIHRRDRRTPAQ